MIYPRPLVYSPADFTMHDHVYTMPNVPDYRRATITFTFDKAARIADVMLIQHTNGVAEIEGFIGNDERSLRSMGRAHSSQGANLPNRDRFFSEGFPDTFKFERAAEGKVFQVHITRTTLSNGYAFYRLYPRNEAQQAIAQR